jgi:pyruvate dehydrogenase E2 component (dihydrolipoamide acetyltransferase)
MEVSVGQVLISIDAAPAASTAALRPATCYKPAATCHCSASAKQFRNNDVGWGNRLSLRIEKRCSTAGTPSIRKIAADLGIDLTRVKGSEAGGRINLGDLRDYVQRLQQIALQRAPGAEQPSGQAHQTPASSESVDFSKWGPVHREKMSPLRRTVSRRMVESWTTIPKINQFADADISNLLALRKKNAPATRSREFISR